MRIIAGKHRGKKLNPPNNLPARPTTDFAKESIFNILHNNFTLEKTKVLDLFAGTGNITFEFFSRGTKNITSVEMHNGCLSFIIKTANQLKAENIKIIKSEVLRYLKKETSKYHIIFADPPFVAEILEDVHQLVFENNLLEPEGWLIMEHPTQKKYSHLPKFAEERNYGSVKFSIFINQ